MTDSIQHNGRSTLDGIIRQTIFTYRWAVILSFGMIGIGFLIALVTDQAVDSEMENPLSLVRQLVEFQASGFFGIGIGLMILTPIVMIAGAAIRFFQAGDQRYGLITTAVAVILSLSIAISFVIG